MRVVNWRGGASGVRARAARFPAIDADRVALDIAQVRLDGRWEAVRAGAVGAANWAATARSLRGHVRGGELGRIRL